MEKYLILRDEIAKGNYKALARAITLVENNINPANDLLKSLKINQNIPVLGITGSPGAGKSTLVNAILEELTNQSKNVAVLAIDPTSPFNYGSLLGDRIRMSKHFNQPNIFIRSLATRGSLGGLSAKTLEIVDILKTAPFDLIIVETVGVGQSEVEIAGLASKTLVVLVPEAGDEIQHLKSGLMEIANAFVVNKADREGADSFANGLKRILGSSTRQVPVFKTIADKGVGIQVLCNWVLKSEINTNNKRLILFAEQAYRLIQYRRMANLDKKQLLQALEKESSKSDFNIYQFIEIWD